MADGVAGLAILELDLPPRLGIAGLNPFRLSVSGKQGTTVDIQRSTDLLEWEDWQSVALDDGPAEITDPDSPQAGTRFYRAIAP